MTLFEKIKTIYPELDYDDFCPAKGTIKIQNDSDGKGDYIVSWNNPILTKPTEEQLQGIE